MTGWDEIGFGREGEILQSRVGRVWFCMVG